MEPAQRTNEPERAAVPVGIAAVRRARPGGVGLGLRWEFLEEVVEGPALDVDFFEVSPENYMRRGGYYPAMLERVRERYPLSSHGLTLSIGALAPPSAEYLDELAREVERLGVPFHSDHLCLSSAGGRQFHDLLPLKFARENVERVAERAAEVERRLGIPLALENISFYGLLGQPEMTEAEFVRAVLETASLGLVLDVNNAYVNAVNHGGDPREFIAALPLERVVEIHVAGHYRNPRGLLIDTHGTNVADPVYELLSWTLERTGPVPVLLERDNAVPALSELLSEVARLKEIYARAARPRVSYAESA
jgi:uncharacterized protein (UPF0276 family)